MKDKTSYVYTLQPGASNEAKRLWNLSRWLYWYSTWGQFILAFSAIAAGWLFFDGVTRLLILFSSWVFIIAGFIAGALGRKYKNRYFNLEFAREFGYERG